MKSPGEEKSDDIRHYAQIIEDTRLGCKWFSSIEQQNKTTAENRRKKRAPQALGLWGS